MRKLTGLFVYPVKSLGGIALSEAVVQEKGLEFDRRWLVIDENADFLTQREIPQMATLTPEITSTSLVLHATDSPSLNVPLTVDGAKRKVRVFRDFIDAIDTGDEAANWLSARLKRPSRLVWMPEESRRLVDPEFAHQGEATSFADGFPFLVLGQASLDDLNNRLEEPVSANRFRSNFLFEGESAFEEDQWKRFRIGDVEFEVVKPCARCIITTTDQEKGVREGKEPLFTLSQYRKHDGKVYFAQNALPRTLGAVRLGDEIEILTRGPGLPL